MHFIQLYRRKMNPPYWVVLYIFPVDMRAYNGP
jgi:hypothetical protein